MAYAFSKFSRLFLYKSSNLCCLCSNCCDKDVICHNKTYNWTIVIRQMLWTRNIHKVDIYKDSRKIWKQLFWMSKFLYCNTVCNPFQGIVFFFSWNWYSQDCQANFLTTWPFLSSQNPIINIVMIDLLVKIISKMSSAIPNIGKHSLEDIKHNERESSSRIFVLFCFVLRRICGDVEPSQHLHVQR